METLANDKLSGAPIELWMKLGARCPHHAMIGPENLRPIGQFRRLEGRLAMGAGKGGVAGRVPVLGEDDDWKASGETIDRLDHRVPIRHGQCPTATEIVLNIDDDQCVGRLDGDSAHDISPYPGDLGVSNPADNVGPGP